MKHILIAGFTKPSYLDDLVTEFGRDNLTLYCARYRPVTTEKKAAYLDRFDHVFDLLFAFK